MAIFRSITPIILINSKVENKKGELVEILSDNGFLLTLSEIEKIISEMNKLKKVYRSLKLLSDDHIDYANERWNTERQEKINNMVSNIKPEKSSAVGHIYLVKSNKTNWYKIGITKSVKNRIETLQKHCGVLHTIHIHESIIGYNDFEKEMHKYWKNKKIFGEWFDLNEADVELFKNWINK